MFSAVPKAPLQWESHQTSHPYVMQHTTQPHHSLQIIDQRASVDSVTLQLPKTVVQKTCSLGHVVPRIEAYMPIPGSSKSLTLPVPCDTLNTPLPWSEPEGQEQTGPYIIGSSLDLLIQLVLILIPEGRVAHQEDIQDDPYKTGHRSLGSVTCFAEEPRKATQGSEPPRKSRPYQKEK